MKRTAILLTFLFSTFWVYAQNETASLMGESSDGKTVKLIWFFKTWDKNTQGFDIKRKSSNGRNWTPVNSPTIVPEISVSKALSNVEPDPAEAKRLSDKLGVLVSKKNTKEISAANYANRLSTDKDALRALSFAIALDYDFALLNGFALVDRTPGTSHNEYGLFLKKNGKTEDKPVATFDWNYGTSVDLNPGIIVNAIPTATRKMVQILWKADQSKLKNANVVGFNIYKHAGGKWSKLNYGPVAVKEKGDFTFFDSTGTATGVSAYAVSAVSMFGNEGNKVEYKYDPADHPIEYKAPELGMINSAGENFENGFLLTWTFPKEYEKFLKGFVVEKNNLPGTYKQVGELIEPQVRTINEKTFSPPATYVQFRLKAVYKDERILPGNERLYYYLPVIYAPKPQNLTGHWTKDNGKTYIDLNWQQKAKDDSLTSGYQLYALNPMDNKMYLEGSVDLITGNSFRYEVFNRQATKYKFVIAAVSKFKAVGHFSDTAYVTAPTQSLAMPVIYPYSVDSSKVILNWTYKDVPDLKGFRVYQNGNLIASENVLSKDTRKFITPDLKIGETYQFTLQAITESGIESAPSIPRSVNVYRSSK
jgi:hypothetical protein